MLLVKCSSFIRTQILHAQNGIPFDTESPMITSGIRLDTPHALLEDLKRMSLD